jgi:plasmid stabilization system protein ParE
MSKHAALLRSRNSKPSSAKNVAYQVALADTAKADANQIYDWVIERAPLRGPEWFEELIDCLYSLEEQPMRCLLAREAEAARRDIRCLLFGKRRGVYRILFEIDETRQTVWVLHIRHGALSDLGPDELSHPEK